MARFGLEKNKNKNTKLLENKHIKKILHVVPGPSTMKRYSTLSKSGRSGQCGTLWLGANWLQMLARARANYKHLQSTLGNVRALWGSLHFTAASLG